LTESFAADQHPATVPAREEVELMALLAAIRADRQTPGASVLLRDLVVKERARMASMLSSSLPTQR
jgi:hypothetical protein